LLVLKLVASTRARPALRERYCFFGPSQKLHFICQQPRIGLLF
jgi:hypothetical protein